MTLYPIVLILAIISAFELYVNNITITGALLDVVLNTKWEVIREYVSLEHLVLSISSLIVIIVMYLFRFYNKQIFKTNWAVHILIALILIIPAIFMNYYRAHTVINRAPYTIINSCQEYYNVYLLNKKKKKAIGLDAKCINKDSLLVILVLGEAVRSDHLQLNGYDRKTTPYLIKDNVISLPNIKSLYTYTAASIPQMLTRSDSLSLSRSYTEESFVSILNRCDYKTVWIANQTPDYTYDRFAKKSNLYKNISQKYSTYSDAQWTDASLIDAMKELSSNLSQSQFICLHSIGSHWYYNYRYPKSFEKFVPTTRSRSISQNTNQELINAYDNSILFMDHFVHNIISIIKNKNAILIYLSDHGELLGEDGKWLHAVEHDVLHDVACFVWMSEKYKRENQDKYRNLLNNRLKNYTTSLLFHTILDACEIQTNVLQKEVSILSP
ncbi:MAG: phosphoethanolamine transferase [Carboxylicivirga sp.]|nr:phosphoethanolamine transferase [Carboxylicivirga sp.]